MDWKRWLKGLGAAIISSIASGGVYKSATAVNAVRFYMQSGNIVSGTIRCYGIPE